MNANVVNDFFRNAPLSIDVEAIQREWRAVSPFYDVNGWQLPLPPWAHRRYDDSGARAWEILRHDLAQTDTTKPMSIYLHVPFCSSKCGFCDSYSFKLGAHQNERIRDYVDRLCYELRLWSGQGNLSQRPISTVHMGGGTPTFLGEAELTRLVEYCKTCFNILPSTEWALESTATALTPSMITTMHDLGYRRLHIGVQSMQDQVRDEIGRRCIGDKVLHKIEQTRALGWIVSVDLICGLPYQTLAGFLDGIETLIMAGINGFSLYELLIYPQNRRWAEQHGLTRRSHVPNYLMFLSGAQALEAHGYTKNLFNHWADPSDANIYFTFPTRGEDLLAIGTIADGVFGNYHYRHPRYAGYLSSAQSGLPGLEGGLRRNESEQRAQPLTVAVLSGYIRAELAADLQSAERGQSLVKRWVDSALVEMDDDAGLRLTASGSWFAGNMIAEMVACMSESVVATSNMVE